MPYIVESSLNISGKIIPWSRKETEKLIKEKEEFLKQGTTETEAESKLEETEVEETEVEETEVEEAEVETEIEEVKEEVKEESEVEEEVEKEEAEETEVEEVETEEPIVIKRRIPGKNKKAGEKNV